MPLSDPRIARSSSPLISLMVLNDVSWRAIFPDVRLKRSVVEFEDEKAERKEMVKTSCSLSRGCSRAPSCSLVPKNSFPKEAFLMNLLHS